MSQSNTSKSPAFQFYPAAFLSSSKVQRMSLPEVGAYITLLSHCWLDHGLVNDLPTLARLVHTPLVTFSKWWSGPLGECFHLNEQGRFINARLLQESLKQEAFREKNRTNANMRWHSGGTAVALPAQCSLSLSLSSSSKKQNTEASAVYAEPVETTGSALATSPTVLTFVTAGTTKSWLLTAAQVQGWAEAYPALDVLAECRKAQAWMAANPTRRKTAKGMTAFLVNWLNRSTDRPSSGPARVTSYGDKTTGNAAAFAAFLAKRQA